jgi:hypothetical protein
MEPTDYTDCLDCWLVTTTRNVLVASSIRLGDALERDSTCLPVDTHKRMG